LLSPPLSFKKPKKEKSKEIPEKKGTEKKQANSLVPFLYNSLAVTGRKKEQENKRTREREENPPSLLPSRTLAPSPARPKQKSWTKKTLEARLLRGLAAHELWDESRTSEPNIRM
jgi:hypothetical protein